MAYHWRTRAIVHRQHSGRDIVLYFNSIRDAALSSILSGFMRGKDSRVVIYARFYVIFIDRSFYKIYQL